MSKFSPAMLVPASQVEAFAKPANARTIKDVALANISKMREQYAAGDAAEGKVNFKVAGDRVAFTIRVSNQPLVLGTYGEGDKTAEVREMTVPKANFNDALEFYADKVRAGEFDAQLAKLDDKKAQRTTKLQATRAARKAAEPTN